MRRLILVPVLVVVALLAIAAGVGYWIYNGYTYYTTDDAQVSGQLVNVAATQAGQLTAMNVKLGDTVSAGEVIGTIATTSATGVKTDVNITAPIAGSVVQASAVQNQAVAPGLTVATIADLNNLYITAYVDEGQLNNIKVNQDVDVHVDAYGNTYNGHIKQIVQATAGSFSLLPASDPTSGNFTKVGQRVPVIVSVNGFNGNDIVPGMSAEVTIHLH